MNEGELKKWIRENIEITVTPLSLYKSDNSVYVSLAFRGEKDPFTTSFIFIPDN